MSCRIRARLEKGRYFDVFAEYAKADADDVLIRVTIANRGPEAALITVLPTLWFRNTWSWGRSTRKRTEKPSMRQRGECRLRRSTRRWATMYLAAEAAGTGVEMIFTENDTNVERLYNAPNKQPYVKDAFDRMIVQGETGAVNPAGTGNQGGGGLSAECAAWAGKVSVADEAGRTGPRCRMPLLILMRSSRQRKTEADEFYAPRLPKDSQEKRNVARQAVAGVLWSKQFYHYIVADWQKGDPGAHAPPPAGHANSRNADWPHLHSRDVISMPDKWEYPWFAAWDLAFHMVAIAKIDGHFAKGQPNCSCASGTCIPTVRYRRTSSRFRM